MEGLKTCQVTKEMDHDVSHQQMLNDTDDQPLSEKIPNNGREQGLFARNATTINIQHAHAVLYYVALNIINFMVWF